MTIKYQLNTAKFLRQLLDRTNATIPIVKYSPSKVEFAEGNTVPLPRSSPEEQGISSSLLEEYYRELYEKTEGKLHSAMIIKNDNVIAECNFSPYTNKVWHEVFSFTKSVTGLAIGFLVEEGKLSLDEKVVKIFDEQSSAVVKLKLRNLTVEHLLTMTSGIAFNEVGSIVEEDWIRGFLEATLKFDPGTKFNYNSMNSYMLAAIVRMKTGISVTEYLKPRLFDPMEIYCYHWETCPKGIEKGGWGLYLLLEDMAKLGALYLNKGAWKGKQLISREWMEAATSKKSEVDEAVSRYDYGYHVWVGESPNAIVLNGMFGQNVVAFPDSGIVAAVTGGENFMFHGSDFFNVSEKYLSRVEEVMPTFYSRISSKKLCRALDGYSTKDSYIVKKSFKRELKEIDGLSYEYENIGSIGIVPILVQMIQNNYTKGIKTVAFSVIENKLFITFQEGEVFYKIPVGLGSYEESKINVNDEVYLLKAIGIFAKNEDDLLTLKVKLVFPEISNTRFIRFYFNGDEVISRWNEEPGIGYVVNLMDTFNDMEGKTSIFDLVTGKLDKELIHHLIKHVLEPELKGSLIKKS
ncbi:serine hydrolase domain-containing protein [Alloiococcus sp. CFN-8]|uniref:serine hydrolase domain-containing protein n=1 Tax=Alloiococcus sp. CFN-8 TaxID=3416081 RepID=UPI003CEF3A53